MPGTTARRDVIRALRDPDADVGAAALFDMAERHPTPAVREALLDCAVDGDSRFRGHATALALYSAGGAREPFDWAHRPLFLRFGEAERAERGTRCESCASAWPSAERMAVGRAHDSADS